MQVPKKGSVVSVITNAKLGLKKMKIQFPEKLIIVHLSVFFFQHCEKWHFIQGRFKWQIKYKLSIICFQLKLLLIGKRLNIPFSFSRVVKQFVGINYTGLKLGALKDGNIPLPI